MLTATVVLAASWLWRYRTEAAPLALDAVEMLATAAFAVACPDPAIAFGFAFSASWLRMLFGSSRQAVVYGLGIVLAIGAAVPLWEHFPGHAGTFVRAGALGALPVLFLTITVARYLAVILFSHEQSQERDAALLRFGNRLMDVTERSDIIKHAWVAIEQICRSTPGLRAIVVRQSTQDVMVLGSAGDLRHPPTALPSGLLPTAVAPGAVQPLNDVGPLSQAVGLAGHWVAIGMPRQAGDFVLLGCPGRVPTDGVVAVQSLLNQLALALQASDAHEALWTQARTDSLTGLANRAAFSSALASHLDRGTSAATLLLLDLDDFKAVNDKFGHAVGDELLRHVADRLRAATRPTDVCARLGGDEFAVLLTESNAAFARAIAERLIAQVSTPVTLCGRGVHIGVSIGVACSTPGITDQDLVHRADLAMYEAKGKGKNRVHTFDLSNVPLFSTALDRAHAPDPLLSQLR
ncbi:GGDEF domain-containing protein [Modestobacter italicus]|uniref:GGDEF domain-containing protein n=1 Tax=Modestobacter italicus (strain DSM 44449 / CECT 9708 / BC 501) TaxID=2732864 RepID=UPI0006874C0E|nr:GGDEF domain-containing protein [Modestobacter marinus]